MLWRLHVDDGAGTAADHRLKQARPLRRSSLPDRTPGVACGVSRTLLAVVRGVGTRLGALLDLAVDPVGWGWRTWLAAKQPHRAKHWVHLDAQGNVLAQGVKAVQGTRDPRQVARDG